MKNYFYSHGIKPQLYRLIYVIIATGTLLIIVIFSWIIETEYVFSQNKVLKFAGLVLAGWGFVIAKTGFKSYDTKAFLGLGSLKDEDEFKTDGLLKKVRHPVYSGSILLVLGYLLFDPEVDHTYICFDDHSLLYHRHSTGRAKADQNIRFKIR